MAIETITLISLVGHTAALLSGALPDGAQVDGSAVEVAKCFPLFLKKRPPLQAHYEKRMKALEASLEGGGVNMDELKAVARDVFEKTNSATLREFVKGEELIAANVCATICGQEHAKAAIRDASADVEGPLTQMITALVQAWIDAPETRHALWVDEFNAIIRLERELAALHAKVDQVLKNQSTENKEKLEQSGLSDAQLLKLVQAFEEANQPQETWFDLLLEKAALLQDLQARLTGISNDDPEVDALRQQAEQAIEDAQFADAETLLERAEAIDESARTQLLSDIEDKQQTLSQRTESQARSAFARGELAESRLKYTVAYIHYRRAYDLTPDNDERLNKAYEFAWRGGDYAEAVNIGRTVLEKCEEQHSPDSPEVATALNKLALQLYQQGNYAETEPLYQRSIAIGERTLGPEHPDVAIMLNNLAALYREQGNFAEAEPLYTRAIAIGEKTLGPDHPNLATRLNNLAGLYGAQGKYAEAEPLYRRDLAICEQALGPDHPDVAITLNNLAGLYQAQGKYAEAEPLYKRDLAICEKALGPEHPHVANTLNNLAELYKAQGKYAEAEPLYTRAIAILEKAFPDGHPNLDTCRANYAELKAKMG